MTNVKIKILITITLTRPAKLGHGEIMQKDVLLMLLLGLGWPATLHAQTAQRATVNQDTTLSIDSRQVSLSAGTKVQVLSQRDGKAVISFTGADGSPVITEMASSFLSIQAAASAPPVATSPQAPPSTPSVVAAPAVSTPLHEGWQKIKFPELPAPDVTPPWITYNSRPDEEEFHVYVPKGFDPQKTYGFLGWISSSDTAPPPKKFQALYDEYGLIVVGAEKAGNNVDLHHRIELLVSSLLEISKWAKIDPNRRLISGISGGGRASTIAAFCYPHLFNGVVPWVGADYYRDFDDIARKGSSFPGYPADFKTDVPGADDLDYARQHTRFALLTGTKDFNRNLNESVAAAMKSDGFQVTVLVEPGLKHEIGSAEIMRQGLDFVLNKTANTPASP
jgi:hypothetical protein